ncbi:hypothetical protein QCA50_014803 [Cerrena zonata]|uniref:Ubiquitin-like protease family profile domain-containing protein n=1 Tax=Cerrena zonata TaxID=2478898 RepID=A0AAW0FXX7_9APHY
MKRILDILGVNANKSHYIVVAQYKRADYGVGAEENFHWAIIILEDINEDAALCGPCYQVFDRHFNDERGVEWHLYNKPVTLGRTDKSLGGVVIGTVKQKDLVELGQILSAHLPIVKFEGWNCRDWVIEAIQLLRVKGWIPTDIKEQASLLPSLRAASTASDAARKRGRPQKIITF